MNFLDKNDENIIICKSYVKEKILKELSKEKEFYNIKFIDFNEIKAKIYFDYDYNALNYLINNTCVDKNELLIIINALIINDKTMRENNIQDIVKSLNITLNNNIFKRNLKDTKNNWLDISVDEVVNNVINYFTYLEKIIVTNEDSSGKININSWNMNWTISGAGSGGKIKVDELDYDKMIKHYQTN